MSSIEDFLFHPSITQSLLWLTIVMTIGLWLGEKAKIKSFSLGVTWVLFVGIALASVGVNIDHSVAQFAKDFGLILFVYSIGLQVGPSFSPFKRGVLQLNMLAAAIVLLACVCTIVLHYVTGIDMATMTGVMSGAVTSTPSLASAQQAYQDLTGTIEPTIATGYAVAYPLSIVGLILAFELVRRAFRISLPQEEAQLKEAAKATTEEPVCVDITLNNPQLDVLTIDELVQLCPVKEIVVSRVIRPDGSDELVNEQTTFRNGDTLRVLTEKQYIPTLRLLGQTKDYDLHVQSEKSNHLISRRRKTYPYIQSASAVSCYYHASQPCRYRPACHTGYDPPIGRPYHGGRRQERCESRSGHFRKRVETSGCTAFVTGLLWYRIGYLRRTVAYSDSGYGYNFQTWISGRFADCGDLDWSLRTVL